MTKDPKPKCGAKKRQSEGDCARPAGWGTDHAGNGRCKLHGGSTRTGRIVAQREVAEQAVKTYGLPLDVSPTDALLEEVRWTAGHVQWLRERVQEVEQDALTWGMTQRAEQQATEFPGVNITESAAPNVWLDLYQRERKHLLDVCKAAISAGIEERRVRLAEHQGSLLASVIRAILNDLSLSPEQSARVAEVVPRHLRSVGA